MQFKMNFSYNENIGNYSATFYFKFKNKHIRVYFKCVSNFLTFIKILQIEFDIYFEMIAQNSQKKVKIYDDLAPLLHIMEDRRRVKQNV